MRENEKRYVNLKVMDDSRRERELRYFDKERDENGVASTFVGDSRRNEARRRREEREERERERGRKEVWKRRRVERERERERERELKKKKLEERETRYSIWVEKEKIITRGQTQQTQQTHTNNEQTTTE